VQPPEDPGAPLDERLDLEVLFPDCSIPEVLRQAGEEQIRRLEEVTVGRNNEFLRRHRCVLPAPTPMSLVDPESRLRGLREPCPYDIPTGRYTATALDGKTGALRAGRRRRRDEAVDAAPARLDVG
jgi:hypothetical protein